MAKILLVEDDTNLSEIYQARMEAEGYIVVAASDGESALAVAAKEKPDLIISDVMMPRISGFEMLDILRNTDGLKNTPVIMLTALGQADDKSRAEQLGADRYLVKSQVTLEDIVNAAHSILEGDNTALPPVLPRSQGQSQSSSSAPSDTATTATTTAAIEVAEPPAPAAPVPAPDDPAPTGPLQSTAPASLPDVQDGQLPAADNNATDATANDESQSDTASGTAATPASVPIIPVAVPGDSMQEQQEPSADGPANTPEQPEPPRDARDARDDNPPASEDSTTSTAGGGPAGENFTGAGNPPAPSVVSELAATQLQSLGASMPHPQAPAQENAATRNSVAGYEHRPVAPVPVPAITEPIHRSPQAATVPVSQPVTAIAQQPAPLAQVADQVTPQPPEPAPDIPGIPIPVQLPSLAAPTEPAAPVPDDQAPTPSPQTADIPSSPAAAEEAPSRPVSIDEKVVANAIDQLLIKTPQAARPQPAPADTVEHGSVLPSPPETPSEQTVQTEPSSSRNSQNDRPLKKIISPIPRPHEATLEELVAKEEAQASIGNQTFQPNTLAATPGEPSAETAMPAAPPPANAQPRSSFDPNSIAL